MSLFALNDQGGLVQQKNVVYTEMEGEEYNILGILNIVYGEVNGLSITDTSYILTGVYNDNVFASAVNKQSGEVNNTFITNYSEYSECVVAQESKMVQIDRNTNIVLWQTIVDGVPSVKYVNVDKNGNIVGKIKTAFNALLSDCQPIYDNDAICWYTIKDGVNTLYTISDLKFSGNFEPLGSEFVDETDIWNGTADSSWYDDSKDSFSLTDPAQLAGLSELVNNGNDMSGKTFVLKNDIYLNSDRLIQKFVPIAKMSSKMKFSGMFDGNGHTIYRLYRREDDDSTEGGLFGTIGKYGVVKNLKIDQSYVCQDSGVFAAANYGTIMFCENMGKITSATTELTYTGGIVGKNFSMIYGCANKGRVVGYSGLTGGIAGFNSSIQGCIKCCYNFGEVRGGGFSVGGILGYNTSTATVEDCCNMGNVIGTAGSGSLSNYANYVGGIVGELHDAYIVNCISTVNIEKIIKVPPLCQDKKSKKL